MRLWEWYLESIGIGYFRVKCQSEAECESTDMKVIFYSHANKVIFKGKVFHFPRLTKKS